MDVGLLWNQAWSVAGDKRREDVNHMFLQPFLVYQATRTITLNVNSETTADWEVHGDDRWTVPVLFQVAKLDKFGPFPASYQLGASVFPEHPDAGTDVEHPSSCRPSATRKEVRDLVATAGTGIRSAGISTPSSLQPCFW